MPGTKPFHNLHAAVQAVPAFQLYVQLYRQQHAVLEERALATGVTAPLATAVANEVFVWLYAQPALLTTKERATAFLFTALDELLAVLVDAPPSAEAVPEPRVFLFQLLAARHAAYFEQAILQLPAPDCSIASLCYQGYTEREIARRVNIAYSIVKRRLSFSLYLLTTQFAKKPKAPV